MFRRFRHFLSAAQWVMGVATVWSNAGYLPQAGPVALRFRAPAPVNDQDDAPVAPVPPAPISLPSPPMPSGPKETTVVAPIPAATNGPALEFNARDPAKSSVPMTAPEAVISPQMLIKYFTASTNTVTNTASVGAIAPVDFTPPLLATPPPSGKAANSSPP